MEISVKFCTEHIIRNIVKIYTIPKQEQQLLRQIVMGCQQATKLDVYLNNIDKSTNIFLCMVMK
jgi:hypothetical protein